VFKVCMVLLSQPLQSTGSARPACWLFNSKLCPSGGLTGRSRQVWNQAIAEATKPDRFILSIAVWTGPGLALGPRTDPARGSRACAWSHRCSGPGRVQMIAIKRHRTFRAFTGHSFFTKRKLFVVAIILCSWYCRAPKTNPTYLIFSGIFAAAPSQKYF
jgi:hypothetical protein